MKFHLKDQILKKLQSTNFSQQRYIKRVKNWFLRKVQLNQFTFQIKKNREKTKKLRKQTRAIPGLREASHPPIIDSLKNVGKEILLKREAKPPPNLSLRREVVV